MVAADTPSPAQPLCGPLVPALGMASLSYRPHPVHPNRHHRIVKLLSQGEGFQAQADPPPIPLSPTSLMGASESPQKTGGLGAEPRWVSLGKPGTCCQSLRPHLERRKTWNESDHSLGSSMLVSISQTRKQARRGGPAFRAAGPRPLLCDMRTHPAR